MQVRNLTSSKSFKKLQVVMISWYPRVKTSHKMTKSIIGMVQWTIGTRSKSKKREKRTRRTIENKMRKKRKSRIRRLFTIRSLSVRKRL